MLVGLVPSIASVRAQTVPLGLLAVQNVFFFLGQGFVSPGIELTTAVVAVDLDLQEIAGIAGTATAFGVFPTVIAHPDGVVPAVFHDVDFVGLRAPTDEGPQGQIRGIALSAQSGHRLGQILVGDQIGIRNYVPIGQITVDDGKVSAGKVNSRPHHPFGQMSPASSGDQKGSSNKGKLLHGFKLQG